MSPSCARAWTPDVFVSFGNDDQVSRDFNQALCTKLKQRGIGFRHTEGAKKETFPQAMIPQARLALVLLSKEYTHSSKCLEELVKILSRRGESEYPSLVVIPIFPDPAQVLNIRKNLVRDQREKEWKLALAQVGGIPGYKLTAGTNDVAALVTTIIERLVNEMQSLYSYKVFGPFGGEGKIYWHCDEINGIEASYTEFIDSIIFQVEDGANNDVHPGRRELGTPFKVKLKKKECITHFEGFFHRRGRIASLTFETNTGGHLTTINPLNESGEPFYVPSVAEEIFEIFGGKTSRNGHPTSIGAHVELKRADPPPQYSHPVGLFGSRKGERWDHRDTHPPERRITVALDSIRQTWVPSIAFLNDEEKFEIEDEDEYLSSISGSLTSDGITSLTFLTNKRRTKTIGAAKGTHFSSPLADGKIVGFYGWRKDTHLHGIGAYFELTRYRDQVTTIGPFGGAHAWDDGIHTDVKKIYLSIDGDIRYIRFAYAVDGEEDHEVTHPESVSPKIDGEKKVPFNYRSEYLTSIAGYTRDDGSIQSLTFYTNKNRHDFGDLRKRGKYFGYPSNGTKKIVGFHGTWGKTLNSIGAYVKPILPDPPLERFGPFPNHTAGVPWKDGKYSHVIGYRVVASGDPKKIESITFMYDDNGSLVEGSRHGGGDPSSGEWTMLNFPEERLTSLVGRSREDNEHGTIIHNLQLNTTHRSGKDAFTYARRKELAGSEEFRIVENSDEGGRRISGFRGRAGTCLNSIGAYVGHY